MKTTIVLDKVVLTSAFTMEELKKVEKFNPEELRIVDKDGEPVFVLGVGDKGEVSKYGVTYNKVANDGKAAVELLIKGETPEEKKTYVAEELGRIIASIKVVEDGIETCLAVIAAQIEDIKETVEVLA